MKKVIEKFFQLGSEKREINYFYFSILLTCICSFAILYFLCLKGPLFGVPLFFLIYAFGQALLEVGILVLISYLLNRWAKKWIFFVFISLSFLFILLHFTNFMMVRILDTSIAYLFKFFFGNGIEHILVAFQALNMNIEMILISAGLIALIPLLGILLYRLTLKAIEKRPFKISLRQIGQLLICLTLSLLLLDLCAYPCLPISSYSKYQKALPLGTAFLSPPSKRLSLPFPLAPPRSGCETFPSLRADSKPNLYFFVIETLRKDFVNEETAPNLSFFAKENIEIPQSFSNSTSTQLSWFAIFYANSPLHWTAVRDMKKKASEPLKLLKNLGYKIRVYTAADLRYFQMDKILFGDRLELVDQFQEPPEDRPLETWEKDALTIDSFERDIKSGKLKEGNLFLFFLDSTHSEYSFPSNFPLKFNPISKQIDYFAIDAKNIEPVKNRYRNAIAYIDSQMGRFFEILKKEGLYEDAIVVVTGDHGEEFFEDGALFHGTHLNHVQTSVPIFLKFQNNPWTPEAKSATHIDLFPSILHYLTKEENFKNLFDGQSIFSKERCPYRIAVLQNGHETPFEFTISRDDNQMHLRFSNSSNIYQETELEILSLKTNGLDCDDPCPKIVESSFAGAFAPLLRKDGLSKEDLSQKDDSLVWGEEAKRGETAAPCPVKE